MSIYLGLFARQIDHFSSTHPSIYQFSYCFIDLPTDLASRSLSNVLARVCYTYYYPFLVSKSRILANYENSLDKPRESEGAARHL